MLIQSSTLILSTAEDALPDGTPLILYDNRVTIANITSDSEDADYPVTNLANPATNLEWRGASNSPTATTVQIDATVNSVVEVDAVGIARHNFGTEGIAVTVYHVTSDSPNDEHLLAGPQIPSNDEPLLFQFTAQSVFKIRVELTVPASIVPRAAVMYVGKLLVTERGFDVGSDFLVPRFARKTDFVNGRSWAGDFLGRIVTSESIENIQLQWRHFTPAWYRSYFDPFVEAAQNDTPFFLAWSPDDYPYEVAYVWLADDPLPPTSPITGRVGISLKLDGIKE